MNFMPSYGVGEACLWTQLILGQFSLSIHWMFQKRGNSHIRLYISCCNLCTKPLYINPVSAAGGSVPLFGALGLPHLPRKTGPCDGQPSSEFPSNGKDKNQQSIGSHCALFLTCFHSDPLFYFSKNRPSWTFHEPVMQRGKSVPLSRRPACTQHLVFSPCPQDFLCLSLRLSQDDYPIRNELRAFWLFSKNFCYQ